MGNKIETIETDIVICGDKQSAHTSQAVQVLGKPDYSKKLSSASGGYVDKMLKIRVTSQAGPLSTFESGEDLGATVHFIATVPQLVWAATGEPIVAVPMTVEVDSGAEAFLEVIPTDLDGWMLNGEPIVVDADHASHAYTVTIQPMRVGADGIRTAVGAALTYQNVIVPSGELPIDLDILLGYDEATGKTVGLPNVAQAVSATTLAKQAASGARADEKHADKISRRRLIQSIGIAGTALVSGGIIQQVAAASMQPEKPAVSTEGNGAASDWVVNFVRSRSCWSVKDFGAVGDGNTNEMPFFQSALDSGETTLFVPDGNYRFDGNLMMTKNNQKLIGIHQSRTRLIKPFRDGTNFLTVSGQTCVVSGLFFECTAARNDNLADTAIHFERVPLPGGGRYASVDGVVEYCRFREWHTGTRIVGQGLTYSENLISLSRYGVELDFPADYVPADTTVQSGPWAGFRFYRLSNIRNHGMRGACVRNVGPFASQIRSVFLDGYVCDHQGTIWQGAISQSVISNFHCDSSGLASTFELWDGSHDYTIMNGRIGGRPATAEVIEAMPNRAFLMKGTHTNAKFSNLQIENIDMHGLRFDGPVHNAMISDVQSVNVGETGTGYSPISFGDPDTQARLNNIEINQLTTVAGTPVQMAETGALTDIRGENVYRVGDHQDLGLSSPGQGVVINGARANVPTQGYWRRGSYIRNTAAASGAVKGWVCIAAGSPGAWIADDVWP